MKIEGDKLTVFPIGIDEAPRRSNWMKKLSICCRHQDTPVFVPKIGLGQKLIEPPVVIDTNQVKPLKRVVGS